MRSVCLYKYLCLRHLTFEPLRGILAVNEVSMLIGVRCEVAMEQLVSSPSLSAFFNEFLSEEVGMLMTFMTALGKACSV